MACHGNGSNHCCYVPGSGRIAPDDGSLGDPGQHVCPHLEVETVPGRHWVCGLLRRYGDWSTVHASPEYRQMPAPQWREAGVMDCGDFRGGVDPETGDVILQCCHADEYPVVFHRDG